MKPVTFPMISLLVVSVRVAAVPCGRGCHFAGTAVFLAFAIVLPAS